MATASADLAKLRVAINSLRSDKPDLAASFRAQDFQALLREGYRDVRDLRGASADDLKELGLDEARIKDLKPGGSRAGGLLLAGNPAVSAALSSSRHNAGIRAASSNSWLPLSGLRPSGGESRSLEELLHPPLPDAKFGDLSTSKRHHAEHRETHPTKVEEWPGWEEEVKARLRSGTMVSFIPSHMFTCPSACLLCVETCMRMGADQAEDDPVQQLAVGCQQFLYLVYSSRI